MFKREDARPVPPPNARSGSAAVNWLAVCRLPLASRRLLLSNRTCRYALVLDEPPSAPAMVSNFWGRPPETTKNVSSVSEALKHNSHSQMTETTPPSVASLEAVLLSLEAAGGPDPEARAALAALRTALADAAAARAAASSDATTCSDAASGTTDHDPAAASEAALAAAVAALAGLDDKLAAVEAAAAALTADAADLVAAGAVEGQLVAAADEGDRGV